MQLLLTSGGVRNPSIHTALEDLLGKPIAEADALCIPTATHPCTGGQAMAWRFITGHASPLCELGWKSLGVLELTALPSIASDRWVSAVHEADALLVGGGDCLYLTYWMRESGFADLVPLLRPETVYVGVSAGSMALTSIGFHILKDGFGGTTVGARAEAETTPDGRPGGLGLVRFSLLPHLDGDNPENSLANFEKVAATTPAPSYAIDDQTAITVRDGNVDIVSEGHWTLFTP